MKQFLSVFSFSISTLFASTSIVHATCDSSQISKHWQQENVYDEKNSINKEDGTNAYREYSLNIELLNVLTETPAFPVRVTTDTDNFTSWVDGNVTTTEYLGSFDSSQCVIQVKAQKSEVSKFIQKNGKNIKFGGVEKIEVSSPKDDLTFIVKSVTTDKNGYSVMRTAFCLNPDCTKLISKNFFSFSRK